MQEPLQKKQYYAIDLLKFIMACGIVAAHTTPFDSIAPEMTFWTDAWLIHIPVPFFFAASGFFLYRKMPHHIDKAAIVHYWLRVFRVYAIWTILYLPLICLEISRKPDILAGCIEELRSIFFVGSYFHLWFLRALLISVPLLSFFLWKGRSFRWIFSFFGCTYVILLLFSSYHAVYQEFLSPYEWVSACTSIYASFVSEFPPLGLCTGVFVSIGAYAALQPTKRSTKFLRNGLLLTFSAFLLEGWLVCHLPRARWYDASISLPFFAFFLLSCSLRIQFAPRSIYLHLRKLSMLLFYCHAMFWRLTTALQDAQILPRHSLITFTTTLALALLFSEIIVRLSQRSHFQYLKMLF